MEYQIREHRYYLFDLQFICKVDDIEDRNRVRRLAGEYETDRNGALIRPGVPVSLKFSIVAIDDLGTKKIHEQEASELKMTSHGNCHFNKRIATVPLRPGRYRFTVESLVDVPELVGTPVVFRVGTDPKTLSIE